MEPPRKRRKVIRSKPKRKATKPKIIGGDNEIVDNEIIDNLKREIKRDIVNDMGFGRKLSMYNRINGKHHPVLYDSSLQKYHFRIPPNEYLPKYIGSEKQAEEWIDKRFDIIIPQHQNEKFTYSYKIRIKSTIETLKFDTLVKVLEKTKKLLKLQKLWYPKIDTVNTAELRFLARDFIYNALYDKTPSEVKRKNEMESLQDIDLNEGFDMCGFHLPIEMGIEIMGFMEHDVNLLNTCGLVNMRWYLMVLCTWKTLFLTLKNIKRVPVVVITNIRKINLYSTSTRIHWSSSYVNLKYLFRNTNKLVDVTLTGNGLKDLLVYLTENGHRVFEKLKNITTLSMDSTIYKIDVNLGKRLQRTFPKLKRFSCNVDRVDIHVFLDKCKNLLNKLYDLNIFVPDKIITFPKLENLQNLETNLLLTKESFDNINKMKTLKTIKFRVLGNVKIPFECLAHLEHVWINLTYLWIKAWKQNHVAIFENSLEGIKKLRNVKVLEIYRDFCPYFVDNGNILQYSFAIPNYTGFGIRKFKIRDYIHKDIEHLINMSKHERDCGNTPSRKIYFVKNYFMYGGVQQCIKFLKEKHDVDKYNIELINSNQV